MVFKSNLAIDITTHDVVSYDIFEDDPVVLFVNTVLMEFLLWKSLLMLLLSLLR